jgi:hypothetical protein
MFGFTEQQQKEIRQIIREELKAFHTITINSKDVEEQFKNAVVWRRPKEEKDRAGAPGDYNPAA